MLLQQIFYVAFGRPQPYGHRYDQPLWDTRGGHDVSLGSGARSTLSSIHGSSTYSNNSRKPSRKDITLMNFDLEIENQPRYKRKTSINAWVAFFVCLLQTALVFIVYFAPAWGRTREGNEADLQSQLHGNYGFWLVCYHPVLDSSNVNCRVFSSISPIPGKAEDALASNLVILEQ